MTNKTGKTVSDKNNNNNMDNFVFDLNKFYENSRAAFGHTIRAAVLLGVLAAPELYAQDDPILPPLALQP